jgi:hypothetical protein
MDHDDALRGALRQELDPLAPAAGFEPRIRSRLREHAGRRHARAPRLVLSVVVSLALVAAMVGGFIATRGSGTRSITDNTRVLQDLTSGAAASPVADASSSYVWLTAQGTGPACTIVLPPGSSKKAGPTPSPTWFSPAPSPCASAPSCLGSWLLPPLSGDVVCGQLVTEVDVLDWTGALRYHFQLTPAESELTAPEPDPPEPDLDLGIAAISPDGTRALLDDGTVIDQTGKTVGDLPAVRTLLDQYSFTAAVGVQWLNDDDGVCIAGPSQLLAGDATSATQGAAPGETSVEELLLGGQTRTVAILPTGETTSDTTSVDACSTATDTATVAVLAMNPASSPTSVAVWSVRLSTGAVTYEQNPPARAADRQGVPFSIGSANGSLASEFPWSGKGCSPVAVVNVHDGDRVPIAATLACPSIPALSADGTRFLVSDVSASGTRTTLDLVNAGDGAVVRSVQLPGDFGVAGVAAPDGASFMLLVDGYLVLVDESGGITQLHPMGVDLPGNLNSAGTFSLAGCYST